MNINTLSIVVYKLCIHLGPTNPVLIIMITGNLSHWTEAILPPLFTTNARILTSLRSTLLYNNTSTPNEHCFTLLVGDVVSVDNFSPVHFHCMDPRRVNCNVLFKRWLFLSLPSRCNWFHTYFFTLNYLFGTLSTCLVVSISHTGLSPVHQSIDS